MNFDLVPIIIILFMGVFLLWKFTLVSFNKGKIKLFLPFFVVFLVIALKSTFLINGFISNILFLVIDFVLLFNIIFLSYVIIKEASKK